MTATFSVMYVVRLHRRNGRFVKQSRPFRSSYAAKKFAWEWQEKYDDKTYYLVIERDDEGGSND